MQEVKTERLPFGTEEFAESNVNSMINCELNCLYCLHPDTLILMSDLSEKKIQDIKVGDILIGVKKSKTNQIVITKTVVIRKWIVNKRAYKINLENNVSLICSEDHQWLTERGWKYTKNNLYKTKVHRPHLTINNSIRILREEDYAFLKETESYKKGYLAGLIKGDAHLKRHNLRNRTGGGIVYQFRLALKDHEPLIRCKKYLSDFGVKTNWFNFNNKMKGIRTNKSLNFSRIQFLITSTNNKEFLRGFVAGIFDAEGTSGYNYIRITNSDKSLINLLKKGLTEFNFKFTQEDYAEHVSNIRLLGKRSERLRFFQIFNPSIIRKRKITGQLTQKSRIISIENLNQKMGMIDLETSTGNFIANGCVSHNCYAKIFAFRFKRIKDPEEWKNMKPNMKVINANYRKRQGTIMFPSAHNITINCFEYCLIVLKKLLKSGNKILIVSKPDIMCTQSLLNILSPYKKQIEFRYTITTKDPERKRFWEPNAPSLDEELNALYITFLQGYEVSTNIEPYLDKNPITLIKKVAPFSSEIWLGFMNWIGWLPKINPTLDQKILQEKMEYIRKISSWTNVQKIVENLKLLPEEIRSKIRFKDSIKRMYKKRGLEVKLL